MSQPWSCAVGYRLLAVLWNAVSVGAVSQVTAWRRNYCESPFSDSWTCTNFVVSAARPQVISKPRCAHLCQYTLDIEVGAHAVEAHQRPPIEAHRVAAAHDPRSSLLAQRVRRSWFWADVSPRLRCSSPGLTAQACLDARSRPPLGSKRVTLCRSPARYSTKTPRCNPMQTPRFSSVEM